MKLSLTVGSNMPIYEQIKIQVKNMIISGKLEPHDQMPSMRQLSKELEIGMVTVKRAYDDLVSDKYLYTVPGKGVFVAEMEIDHIRQIYKDKIEKLTKEIISLARESGMDREDLLVHIKNTLEGEDLK